MKNFKKIAAVLVAGALVASVCALAGCTSSKGTLKVITSADYPPYENLENGEFVGFEIELMEALAKEAGYSGVEWENVAFDSLVTAVAAGTTAQVSIAAFDVDPDRAKLVNFTDVYLSDAMSIVAMKDSDFAIAADAKTAVNKAGVKIAVQSGTTCEDYAKEYYPNATIVPYQNANDCYTAMVAGQADVVCSNASVANANVTKTFTDAKVIITDNTGSEYAIIVNKDNSELLEALNAAIQTLKDNGTIASLIEDYEL